MERSAPDPDQYQAELNDAVDDGGGCAEMWAALSSRREEGKLSRRSVLRKAGATTTGLALASTLQSVFASTAAASEEKTEKVLQTVETSEEFQEVRERILEIFSTEEKVQQARADELFSSRKVQEVVIEDTTYPISTHSASPQISEEETKLTVEVSSLVENGAVTQVRGLIKRIGKDETEYISLVHDTSELEEERAQLRDDDLYRNNRVVTQQAQCIPCDSQFCYDSCVAVWDVVCYNDIGDELCSSAYTAAAACIVIGLVTGGIARAICPLFLAAVCEGDIGCYDTPENMCEDSSSACNDPWLN
jgi:hypothetical protein